MNMNMSSTTESTHTSESTIQSLLKRIKDLQEIVDGSIPVLSPDVPAVGYTPSRWHLALLSFQERLPQLKSRNFLRQTAGSLNQGGVSVVEIEFGPEWDLKCAKRELEELLNKECARL